MTPLLACVWRGFRLPGVYRCVGMCLYMYTRDCVHTQTHTRICIQAVVAKLHLTYKPHAKAWNANTKTTTQEIHRIL
jgi:hypothetical protein